MVDFLYHPLISVLGDQAYIRTRELDMTAGQSKAKGQRET